MWRQTLEVARWEFRRFVKPKQLAWSFVLTIVMGAAGYFATNVAERNSRSSARIAVIGGEGLALDRAAAAPVRPGADSAAATAATAAGPHHRLTFEAHPASARDSLRAAVAAKSLDALLEVRGEAAELTVRRDPPWLAELEMRLTAARQATRLREARLAPATLAALLAPATVEVRHAEPGRGRGGRLVAVVAVGAVLYGVFTGVAYLFVSITGEKQLRVTEQILSAVTPQAWIDGKLLGIAGVALVGVLTLAGAALVFVLGRSLAGAGVSLPAAGASPGVIVLVLLFALLGFAFWLAFYGLIAATIDDPNTSSRGPLMFVPGLCVSAGFLILGNPDSPFARGLALFPLTSSAAMPVRLAMTDVAAWEVAASAALLVGAIWVMRRAAGRVFGVAMLLYGKEPSWGEVRRWLREPAA